MWFREVNIMDKNLNEYVAFMTNPLNAHNCKDCPENYGFSSWGGNYPCGQQNCWVTCHIKKDNDS